MEYVQHLKSLIQQTLAQYPKSITTSLMDLPLVGPGGVRQTLGKIDLEFFAKAYFPQYFAYETPDFHKAAYAELNKMLNRAPNGARMVRAWPRANAKSTIYNFFAPCNAALYGKRRFLVQVSESETQAEGFLGDIKSAFENNDYILEDFGSVKGGSWRADMISIRSATGATCWIAAVGAGSSVRGLRKEEFRPDLITIDDLESDESVLTPERISKLHNWFMRSLMNLGTASTDVVMVGTVIAYDCVLDRLLRAPAWDAFKLQSILKWSNSPLWDTWTKIYTDLSLNKHERMIKSTEFFETNKAEMLKDTQVLWADGRSYEYLMRIYVDIGEAAFHAEHQNDPVNLDECLFKPDWLHYYDSLENVRIVETYGALDPSLGKTRLSDFSALIVIGRSDAGFLYVLDAIVERMTPDKIVSVLLQKSKEFDFTRFGIEVNQWQDLLRTMVIERGAKEGVYLPLVELRHNKDKVIRVQSLMPYVKNGYVKFHRSHTLLISQLLGFPKLRHDDGPDCLEMAVRIAGTGSSMMPALGGTAPTSQRSYDDEDEVAFNNRTFFS